MKNQRLEEDEKYYYDEGAWGGDVRGGRGKGREGWLRYLAPNVMNCCRCGMWWDGEGRGSRGRESGRCLGMKEGKMVQV